MRIRWIVVVIAGVVALSGCIPQPSQPQTLPAPVASESSPEPAYTPGPDEPDPAVICAGLIDRDKGCYMVTDECHEWEYADKGDPEQVAGWALQTPVDSGSVPHAAGEVILNAQGVPVAYVVASDDLGDFVSERFCLNLAYLNMINTIRREGSYPLYAGDTLNLDPHTIASVGDQNGVVYSNTPNGVIPPQH